VNLAGVESAYFDHGKWYKVSIKMADYLATIHQKPKQTKTPKAFDVCMDEAEAEDLIRREREEKERGKRPEDAIHAARDLTLEDLPQPHPVSPARRPQPRPEPEEESGATPPPSKKRKATRTRKAAPKAKAKKKPAAKKKIGSKAKAKKKKR
jgi:hypothetical protein